MYVRDLSVKVKTARRARNERGEYTAAFVPYGYIKNPEDRHKLLIYEPEAAVVRRIFDMAAGGKNLGEITRMLNAEKISPPAVSFSEKNGFERPSGDGLWDRVSVLRILIFEGYTGKMVQNRYESSGFGDEKKMLMLPREKQTIVENAAPAIVSEERFASVRDSRNRWQGERGQPKDKNLFRCPFCGRKLTGASTGKYLLCAVRNMDVGKPCKEIHVPVAEAKKKVLQSVREFRDMLMTDRENGRKKKETGISAEEKIRDLERELERFRVGAVSAYKFYLDGEMSKEEYLELRKSREERKKELESELEKIRQTSHMEEKCREELEIFTEHDVLEEYNGEVLGKVIECVYVYPDGNIEIVYRGADVLERYGIEKNG